MSGQPPLSGVTARDLAATAEMPSLRTPEQMEWIAERFKMDGLERLSRAEQDYYDSHGHYLPDVAALAHASLTRIAALEQQLQQAREALGEDAAGREFADLLLTAADVLTARGDGPLSDCLRLKAEQVAALAALDAAGTP